MMIDVSARDASGICAADRDRSRMIQAILGRDDVDRRWEVVDGMRYGFAICGKTGVFLVGDGGIGSILTRTSFRAIVDESRRMGCDEKRWVIYAGRNVYDGPGIIFCQICPGAMAP